MVFSYSNKKYTKTIALTPQVKGPVWGPCQLLSVSILIMHLKLGEVMQNGFGHTELSVTWTWQKGLEMHPHL